MQNSARSKNGGRQWMTSRLFTPLGREDTRSVDAKLDWHRNRIDRNGQHVKHRIKKFNWKTSLFFNQRQKMKFFFLKRSLRKLKMIFQHYFYSVHFLILLLNSPWWEFYEIIMIFDDRPSVTLWSINCSFYGFHTTYERYMTARVAYGFKNGKIYR